MPDTPRQRNVAMFDGFAKSPLWANLYRQELAKESGKPIIQMLMDENYREEPDAKLKPIVVPGQVGSFTDWLQRLFDAFKLLTVCDRNMIRSMARLF